MNVGDWLSAIEWILTVLVPSLIAASAMAYLAKKFSDNQVKVFSYLLVFLTCAVSVLKFHEFLERLGGIRSIFYSVGIKLDEPSLFLTIFIPALFITAIVESLIGRLSIMQMEDDSVKSTKLDET